MRSVWWLVDGGRLFVVWHVVLLLFTFIVCQVLIRCQGRKARQHVLHTKRIFEWIRGFVQLGHIVLV